MNDKKDSKKCMSTYESFMAYTLKVILPMPFVNLAIPSLLGEVLLPSVSFRQNRTTTYGGGILGRTLPLSISVDETWLPDEELTW